jgi:hypothetical protein
MITDVDNLYKFFDQQMIHLVLLNTLEVNLMSLMLHQHNQLLYLKIQRHLVVHVD